LKKLGIEFKIFEDSGNGRKQVLGYRYAPGNLESGIKLMSEKLGNGNKGMDEMCKAIKENNKRIIRGTLGEK